MDKVDVLVIGAGVVGLAIARELSLSGHEVIVVDKEPFIGSHTSSRNSEVIHAGIYYTKNSLKSLHCVKGKQLLYDYCKSKGVGYNNTGKLIVATTSDEDTNLKSILEKAKNNGVLDLQILTSQDVESIYPQLNCTSAIMSPSTGIVNSHELMLAFQSEIESNQGEVVLNTEVSKVTPINDGLKVSFKGIDEFELIASKVVNCAGLWATEIAKKIEGINPYSIPEIKFVKGHYCSYHGKHPFEHLIYPTPVKGGLGTHLTLDMSGQLKLGPDVKWQDDSIEYHMNDLNLKEFQSSVYKYWPSIDLEKITPDYCGIRPKAFSQSGEINDFVISGKKEHNLNNLVCLYGIESPGLTSCLSLAQDVKALINQT